MRCARSSFSATTSPPTNLSPSGAILPESPAGQYLLAHGTTKEEFNFTTRRGDHIVAVRATFANNRLKNEMCPGVEGV